jgi:selenocysteine-specific elongation factor
VAVNLRASSATRSARGDALLTPGAWRLTRGLDVRVTGVARAPADPSLVLHAGSTAVPGTCGSWRSDTAQSWWLRRDGAAAGR